MWEFSLLFFSSLSVNVADFCGQTIQGDGMIINSHQESKKYYFVIMGTDCHLTMQASSPKDKVQFYFRFFLVYSLLRVAPLSPAPVLPESPSPHGSAPLSPRLQSTSGENSEDPCHAGSYVQFYDGRDRSSPPLGPPLCGKSPPRPVLSTGNYLTLRLVTRGTQPRVDFVGDFTSFRLGFNQSDCSNEPYFTCRNGKCIPLSLVCDEKGIDNCGDGSDLEENLTTECARLILTANAHMRTTYVHPYSPASLSLLVLYIIMGMVTGGIVLCWCFWSPGCFMWRISACRFLPCCNSACASCQLCTHSCIRNKDHRPGKVTPHTHASGTPMGTAVVTTAGV
uniref:Low density lipoprotein receptor class A domain containing 2 n=1 Tax=Oreochromis aureus TaxID=47969 RepID=A0A668U5D7_OREAU